MTAERSKISKNTTLLPSVTLSFISQIKQQAISYGSSMVGKGLTLGVDKEDGAGFGELTVAETRWVPSCFDLAPNSVQKVA